MRTTRAASPALPGDPDLTVRLGPLQLAHPVINASGTMEIFDIAASFGPGILADPPVAAYVAKTVTLEARPGNPPPRLLETPGGMINAIGLAGEGLDAFLDHRLPLLLGLPCPVIVSIGGFSLQEYVLLASGLRRRLDESGPTAGSHNWTNRIGVELNISCPNVHSGCASIGADPSETERVVSAVREVWPGLLIAKLTPNVTELVPIAQAAVKGGVDALAAVNTFKGLVIDRRTLRPYLGNTVGGLSGPAIKPLALRCVYELYQAVDVPLIGMGGAVTGDDVLEFLACGARVVAIGSGLFRDPWLGRKVATEVQNSLRGRGLRLDQVVGIAHTRRMKLHLR
jgi:dihydroorotate dehydrogenase (NAD+) catalytic subunit